MKNHFADNSFCQELKVVQLAKMMNRPYIFALSVLPNIFQKSLGGKKARNGKSFRQLFFCKDLMGFLIIENAVYIDSHYSGAIFSTFCVNFCAIIIAYVYLSYILLD